MSLPKDRLQHFLRFQPEKKSAIRIGAFGDSHTYGDEVTKTNTYPYQLQKLFDEYYPEKKVDILNFGVSGHGFQEQFFLWEQYAKSYQLDYILIGPQGLHSSRDVTFRKKEIFAELAPPRERFILSENNLRLIRFQGTNLKDRYNKYYSFFPSWLALRYDRKPFQVFEKIFPFLRNKISNPLYYKKMPEDEESSQINKILLKRIKSPYDKKIFFFTDYKSIFNSYKSEEALYNLNFIRFKRSNFYKVFYHESSLGNEITAKIYFNALTGKKEFSMNIINCHFDPPLHTEKFFDRTITKNTIRKFALADVKSIQMNAGNKNLSSFRRNASNHYWKNSSAIHHIDKKTKSFIALSNKDYFLDSPAYFPVPFQLKEGMSVYIQSGPENKIKLGSIKVFDLYKKIFHFYGRYIKNKLVTYTYYKPYFFLEKLPFSLKKKLKSSLELFIEDYKLGSLYHHPSEKPSVLKFVPSTGYDKSFLMMGPSHYIRNKDLPEKFSLHIQYNFKSGDIVKSPIFNWQCKKEEKQALLNLPNFKYLTWKKSIK